MDDQRSEAMAAFCAIASVDSHTADTYLAVRKLLMILQLKHSGPKVDPPFLTMEII